MKVAALQFEPRIYERARNLDILLRLFDGAFAAGARIAVAPEMATSGYCFYDRADVAALVETLPGPATEAVRAICAQYGSVAVLGLPEVDADTGVYYNSVAVVGPEGLLGRYRKVHSFISEPRWAMDGDLGPVVVETPCGAIGLQDCADIELFEGARALQIMGADLIAFPTNWTGDPAPSYIWWARAWELGLPLVAADRTGVERGVVFSGGSAIFDADGSLLTTRDDGEGILLADVGRPLRAGRTAALPPSQCLALARDTHRFDPQAFYNLYGREDLPQGGQISVAALPLRGSWREIAAGLETLQDTVVVLPEDALTEPPDAEVVAQAAALCRARRIWLAFGCGPQDRVVLVGPGGVLAEPDAAGGTRGAIVNLPGARVGLCRGAELARPETSRLFALEGVDLLLAPDCGPLFAPRAFPGSQIALPGGMLPAADDFYYFIPRVRACTDDLMIAYASADLPCAVIAACTGQAAPSAGGAFAQLDTRRSPAQGSPAVRRKPHLRRRRPEHYRALWAPR